MTRQFLIDLCNDSNYPNYNQILEDINSIIIGNITLAFSPNTFRAYREMEQEFQRTNTALHDKIKKYVLYHLCEDKNFTDQCVDCLLFYLEKKWKFDFKETKTE